MAWLSVPFVLSSLHLAGCCFCYLLYFSYGIAPPWLSGYSSGLPYGSLATQCTTYGWVRTPPVPATWPSLANSSVHCFLSSELLLSLLLPCFTVVICPSPDRLVSALLFFDDELLAFSCTMLALKLRLLVRIVLRWSACGTPPAHDMLGWVRALPVPATPCACVLGLCFPSSEPRLVLLALQLRHGARSLHSLSSCFVLCAYARYTYVSLTLWAKGRCKFLTQHCCYTLALCVYARLHAYACICI